MSNKTDYYRASMELRYVKRTKFHYGSGEYDLVLQQRWYSPVTGEEDQWRELPVVEDGE